ncbi:cyclin-dependent kinase 4 inhibitor B-like [Apostichopus japonicus]|uniref:cyclin-dependent kinase 4 inhibitor B-like n=1 Tax=Stichopus japonicus TaxID=307972 RepID=UPI003AB1BA02
MDHKHSSSCHCAVKQTSVNQTLSELDFERGIWSAALNGETKRIEKLLAKGTDPNALDTSGYTALHYACRNNNEDIATLLLSHGADINITTRSGGASPLHRAAYMGHVRLTKFLLNKGANPSLQDTDGKTALHKASEKGWTEICRLLYEADPSVSHLRDTRGMTAAELVPADNPELQELLSHTN